VTPERSLLQPIAALAFRLLGDFEVTVAGREVPLGQPKQRAVMAMLALRSNSIVATVEIIDALWRDGPPKSAKNQVQVYIATLRRALRSAGVSEEVIRTRDPGYVLDVPAACVDLAKFEHAMSRAGQWERSGDLRAAEQALRSAIGLWRGPPLASVTGGYSPTPRHGSRSGTYLPLSGTQWSSSAWDSIPK
jgi:DNA-binding SARP family transcriptional activator